MSHRIHVLSRRVRSTSTPSAAVRRVHLRSAPSVYASVHAATVTMTGPAGTLGR